MSTLHHESIYETCFDEAWDEFLKSNKLTDETMRELCRIELMDALDAIENMAWKKFQDLCQ